MGAVLTPEAMAKMVEDGGRVAGSPRDVGDAGGGCSHSTFSMAWMEGRVG